MFRELFNVPVVIQRPAQAARPQARGAKPSAAPRAGGQSDLPGIEVQREGAFITVQSLASFPGATAAVTVLVTVTAWAVPAWRGQPLLFVIASAVVGLTIYLINQNDPLKPPGNKQQRLIEIVIAVFNTFVILSAAVGADSMIRSGGAQAASPSTVEVNHG